MSMTKREQILSGRKVNKTIRIPMDELEAAESLMRYLADEIHYPMNISVVIYACFSLGLKEMLKRHPKRK